MINIHMDSRIIEGVYLEKMVQIAEEHSVDVNLILNDLGIDRRHFLQPERRFSFRDFYTVVDQIESQYQIDGFGFQLGSREGVFTHGMLGYALISSPDLRHAIETYERYNNYIGSDIRVSLRYSGSKAIYAAQSYFPLGKYLRFAIEEWLANWFFIGEQLAGGRLQCSSAHFQFPQPSYAYMYTDLLRCKVYFNEPSNEIRFDEKQLKIPFVTSNPSIYQISLGHCESLFRRNTNDGEYAPEIRRILTNTPWDPPTLNKLAEVFAMSARTLRRRLQAEGTTYQKLLFEVRMALAENYLKSTALAPGEIAQLVGYSEVASFYRNFKRWANVTPQEYRHQNG